jgi:23S rRNA pseudouridine1911/1915/1917 synthase
MRLDKLVAQRFGLSRRQAQQAVRRGRVDVSDRTLREPGRDVPADAILSYWPARPGPHAVARRLSILHEDRWIMMVDKPAGWLSQPTRARERGTLLERAGRYLARSRGLSRP